MHGLILSSLQIQDSTVNLERELVCLGQEVKGGGRSAESPIPDEFTPGILQQASSLIFTMISLSLALSLFLAMGVEGFTVFLLQ